MSTTVQDYIAQGDRTADPAVLSFWDPVTQRAYVIEADPVTGAIPVSGSFALTPSPILIRRNGADQSVTLDTASSANNRPLPTTLLAGDSLGPVATGVGISNSQTLRVHLGNGSSIDVNITNTVLDVRVGDSAGNGLTSTNVGGKQSLDTNVTQSALPTGASTSALQTAGNASIASVDTKLTSQATAALQTSGNASLTSIDSKVTAVDTGAVVVASSALPTGAATETTLAAINTKTPTLEAGRVPVNAEITKSNFGVPVHDAINVNVSGGTLDVYTFRTGGVAGTVVGTITINYTDATKGTIASVVRT